MEIIELEYSEEVLEEFRKSKRIVRLVADLLNKVKDATMLKKRMQDLKDFITDTLKIPIDRVPHKEGYDVVNDSVYVIIPMPRSHQSYLEDLIRYLPMPLTKVVDFFLIIREAEEKDKGAIKVRAHRPHSPTLGETILMQISIIPPKTPYQIDIYVQLQQYIYSLPDAVFKKSD